LELSLFGLAMGLAYCTFGPDEYTGPFPPEAPSDDGGATTGAGGGDDDGGATTGAGGGDDDGGSSTGGSGGSGGSRGGGGTGGRGPDAGK
jgi:hypothetical protein